MNSYEISSTDLSEGQISDLADQKARTELESEKDKKHFRKVTFYVLGGLIVAMFIFSFFITYQYIFSYEVKAIYNVKDTNTSLPQNIGQKIAQNGQLGNTFLLTILLMIPTVLSLAMMRFLFGDKKEKDEKNIPSIVINVGKELVEVVTAMIKK